MAQPTKYPYADVIDVMGTYRHSTENGDILFQCLLFPSYRPGPQDVSVYLSELLRDTPGLSETLAHSGLAAAIFFGQRGVDIFSFTPRSDENDNEWLGNGASMSGTYLDGKPVGLESSGLRVNSCDAGDQIASRILDFRRSRTDRETYEQYVFGKEWPNLSPMVDMSRVKIVDFNRLEDSEEES
ncbi:MAG: hypothetical protein ISS48_02095 [Candidatus Aenigmarchaeota archaeon]|nr:hypothetical protein [Candidatus Aenigmarchaeota archaeon]